LNFYNPKLDKPICEFLKETDSSIVTIGNASRILPLTCRKKILIDTTQIDFIPYSKNSLPKLKNIMEDVYGLIFSSRIDSSNIVNHLSKPIGAIDENIVRKIWETRSVSTWKELGCQYNFQYLVLPKNFRIQLNPILISDSLVLYYVEKNCLNTSKKFVGDFLSSLPIEYTDRQFFYWQTEKPSTFYLKNINVDATNVYLYLTFLPNPCKNRYEININYNLNNYSIEVGDKLKNYQLIMVSNPGNYQKLIISLKGFQKECVIKNEVRTLVTQISNISIQ
jgi:hypothetical protein